MRRRKLITLAAAALGWLPGARAANAASRRVPLQQVQTAVDERFPLRYPVAGLFELEFDRPRLRVLPELDRLASALPVRVAGPALRRAYRGDLDLDFRLRYEASDRTVRAHAVRVAAVRVPGLAGEAARLLEDAATELAGQALLEVVLHRLQPRDLALADAIGLEPDTIRVTEAGLLVLFANKRRSASE